MLFFLKTTVRITAAAATINAMLISPVFVFWFLSVSSGLVVGFDGSVPVSYTHLPVVIRGRRNILRRIYIEINIIIIMCDFHIYDIISSCFIFIFQLTEAIGLPVYSIVFIIEIFCCNRRFIPLTEITLDIDRLIVPYICLLYTS